MLQTPSHPASHVAVAKTELCCASRE